MAALVTLVTGSALVALPATGADAATTQTNPVMVILDASGSMNSTDAPGPRITAAKQAVNNLADSLPPSAEVGLEVYGTHTGNSPADKAAGCKDISLLQTVQPINPAEIKAKVASITAHGYTPIGNALRAAAQQLPKAGPRSIVLVSDGEDTCAPPDPCTVAQQLKAEGIDLTIDTIGFKVDENAREQLSCIATATGGSYFDAGDAGSLSTQLNRGVALAIKPYSVVGQPVDGTPTPAGAPELEPGQYVDNIPGPARGTVTDDGPPKYYRITVRKGWTPYVSMTLIPPATRTGGGVLVAAQVKVTAVDGSSSCEYDNFEEGTGGDDAFEPLTVVASSGAVGGPDWPSACPTEGTLLVRVTREGDIEAGSPLRAELSYRLEPPADTTGQPPAAASQPEVTIPAPTTAGTPVVSGTSFNDAPVLPPGTYSDSIVSGETRFVGIKLDWGQRLAYRIDTSPVPGLGVFDAVEAYSHISNPLRENVSGASGNDGGDIPFLGSAGDEDSMSATTLVPVRYENRTSLSNEINAYSIAGTYYVSFFTGQPPQPGEQPYATPYRITLRVIGAPEPGPKYAAAVPAPPASGASPHVTPTSVAQGSGGQGSGARAATASGPSHVSAGGGLSPFPFIGGGAALVVLAGAGVFFAQHRRRQRTSQT